MIKQIPIRCKGSRYIPFGKLKTFQGNLKEMLALNADKLKASILKYGWVAPVFVWNKNEILDGHGRLLVLGELLKDGYTIDDLPVVDIEAGTKKEAAGILLAINSKYQTITDEGLYQFMSEMDLGMEDLGDIVLPDIDMEAFVDNFFNDVTSEVEEEEIPEVPAEPKTKKGDIYVLGRHRLLCGDSTIITDVEKLMNGQRADMVFTDPPWNVAYGKNLADDNAQGYKVRTIMNDSMDGEKWAEFLNGIVLSLLNSLKTGGIIYCVMGSSEWPAIDNALRVGGFHWSSTIIWVKDSLILSRKDYHTQYEPIWYGWQKDAARLQRIKDRTQSDIWRCARPKVSPLHPTTKPIELIERAISNSSQKKSLVLDLFLGSGSTLIAAEKTGRICYGMELDPGYCDVIVSRYVNLTGDDKVVLNGKRIKWENVG